MGMAHKESRRVPTPGTVRYLLTAGPVPVPVNLTVCGLLDALPVAVSVAVRVPPAEGVNVTLI
jgi:hypothetical protein